MNLDTQIRNLARSTYWQNLYNSTQKCNGVRLFENVSNFSGLQVRFLYWLSTYNMLFTELATHEDELLNKEILEDEYRTDAYLIYRNKKQDYLWKKHREEEKQAQLKATRKKGFKHPGKESVINVDLRRK
jgi:hypothetical protein